MPPRRALDARETQVGEKHALRGHPDVEQQGDVERSRPHRLGDDARVPRHLHEAVAAPLELTRELVRRGARVKRRDMKAIAREVRDPAQEVAADRRVPKFRRDEPDADPLAFVARLFRAFRELRPRGAEQRRQETAITALQRDVVLALVGKEEVRPLEFENRRRVTLPERKHPVETGEPRLEPLAPSSQIRVARIDEGKHQRFGDRRVHVLRLELERVLQDGNGGVRLILFAQRVGMQHPQVGNVGHEESGPAELDLRRIELPGRQIEPAQPGPVVPRFRLELHGARVASGRIADSARRKAMLRDGHPLGGGGGHARSRHGSSVYPLRSAAL
jgi:hypothetical protein